MASSSSSLPSSFSIFSTSQRKNGVFLSFRGEDTGNTAAAYLTALERRGIYTFKDDEKVAEGKTIKPELLKAIEEFRFAVVILSENYASSTWCLEELVKIIDCEREKRMTVLPIFYHVDPSDLRKLKGGFGKAFDEHEKQFKGKVGTWRDALNHVAGIVGYHHIKNSPLSEAVKWIVGQLSHISSFEFSQITKGLVGIDSRLVELESCLALKDDVRFIGIWAMGGMGKSTLASVVYRMVSKEFEASCFIENVRGRDILSLQEDLISQILHEEVFINNCFDGGYMIKKNLWNKKVLIVFDDVDESEKLETLVRKSDRFGLGSRIIITTRHKHLLMRFRLDEDEIFEVKALNYEDALCLFCLKAFKKEQCPDEYLELSKSILEYVNGLPLALEVFGSFLFEKSTAAWEEAVVMLKEDPDSKINQVLKISLGGLPNYVMEIFKDIACFFNHEKKDYVVGVLRSIGRPSYNGLLVLIYNSLLKISETNLLCMHDLVRDMGRNIVYQESPDEPGKRSRLWHYKDIDHVLKNNTGTEHVLAIDIKGAEDTSIYHEEKEACWRPRGLAPLVTLQGCGLRALSWQGLALLVILWGWVQRNLSWQGFTSSKKPKGLLWNSNTFLNMPNIKFLRIRSISLQLDTLPLPNNLSYLECNDYPLRSLHSFPVGLVELRLPCSKIELLWGGMKIFEYLKSINMDGSSDLIISPNFSGVQNLEELVLARCSNLRELHPSVGKLKRLKLLDLKGCQELNSLPNKFEMESLVTLNLTSCSKVEKIPEFVGNMDLLQKLLLEGTAIIELPSSVECLTSLNILILHNCKNLVCLPNTICSLTSLNNLDLSGCSKFDKLPEDLGNIVSLKELCLSKTAIRELPSSFEFLTVTSLDLTDCTNFVLLPSTICSLKSLDEIILSGCSKFDKLPMDLGNIVSLKTLRLRRTAIKELPSSVEFLIGLVTLDLTDCKEFVLLPNTICSLKSLGEIFLCGCSKFDKLPKDLGNIVSLKRLYLSGTSIKELPSSVEFLIGLATLALEDCKKFVLLPSTVCSLKSLKTMYLSRCPKFVNLPENFGNLKRLNWLCFEGTAIEVLPSSVGRLAALKNLNLKDCKNLVCLPNTICDLKRVEYLTLTGCSKIANLPENLGNMESLRELLLGGTDIKELPSSTIHLKWVERVSFKGCQLSSSSLTSMPRSQVIDLSDCNLSAIPSGIDRFFKTEFFDLFLGGNDFVSLPKSVSQFSALRRLYLDGCKSLRSLANIPSKVYFICVDNCTSLERLPEPHNDFYRLFYVKFSVQCFNCFKLADNIQNFSNMFQGQSGKEFEKCYIIPGREIPKWFEKVNICDTSVGPRYKTKKVKIKLPGSGCDEWRGIVLCVVFLPSERHHRYEQVSHEIIVNGCQTWPDWTSEYGKVESHHLWLHSVSKNLFHLPNIPGCSIDKKGFHQVELEIQTRGLEVEKIGFRVV